MSFLFSFMGDKHFDNIAPAFFDSRMQWRHPEAILSGDVGPIGQEEFH